MRSIDFGIGFELTPNGGFILDIRQEPYKLVGLIMMSPTGRGYTVCPFVRKSLEFSTNIPNNMRSPRKVQEWVITHVVSWKKRKYTILNFLIHRIDKLPRLLCTIQNNQFQLIVLQIAFACCLIVWHELERSIPSISTKGIGAFFLIWGLLNAIRFTKDPFDIQ